MSGGRVAGSARPILLSSPHAPVGWEKELAETVRGPTPHPWWQTREAPSSQSPTTGVAIDTVVGVVQA